MKKNSTPKRISVYLILLFLLNSCSNHSLSPEETALVWTNEIKLKIMAESNVPADSVGTSNPTPDILHFDCYKDEIKLKEFSINLKTGDTIGILRYSANQKFVLVNEYCDRRNDRKYEGLKYLNKVIGRREERYCSGELKSIMYNFERDVGEWASFDKEGKVIETTDYGNAENLKKLVQIKYD